MSREKSNSYLWPARTEAPGTAVPHVLSLPALFREHAADLRRELRRPLKRHLHRRDPVITCVAALASVRLQAAQGWLDP